MSSDLGEVLGEADLGRKRKFDPVRTHNIRRDIEMNKRRASILGQRITRLIRKGVPPEVVERLQYHHYVIFDDLFKTLQKAPEELFMVEGVVPEIAQLICDELGLDISPSELRAYSRKAKRVAKIRNEKRFQNETILGSIHSG